MYNRLTKKLTLKFFGINLKFQLPLKIKNQNERLENLIYELADPRTLKNIRLPRVLNLEESLDELIKSKNSLARYGDGEFKIMLGESINFQKYEKSLAERLKEILRNKTKGITIAIPDTFGYCPNDYFRRLLAHIRNELYKYITFDTTYFDAFMTRQFIFSDRVKGENYYNKFKKLWDNQEIIIVEGIGTHLGIGNDLFSNAKSINRIICPNQNAYSKYNEILKFAIKQPKNKLFLLALGPTATVLTYDLAQNGFRAIDIGHLDIMYEMFLKNAQRLTSIENKIVFNSERKNKKFKHCTDCKYYEEKIADFS